MNQVQITGFLALRRNVHSTRFTFWSLLAFRWNRSSYCRLSQNHSPPPPPQNSCTRLILEIPAVAWRTLKHFRHFRCTCTTLWVLKQHSQCTNKYNIGVRWRNHCCSGKSIRITYSERVSVALVIQHTRRIVFCGLSGTTIFLHIIS